MIRTRRGFTLIEVMVVIAVLSVVTAIGGSALFRMTSGWRQIAVRNDMNDAALRAFDAIRRDVAQLVSPAATGLGPLSQSHMETRQRYNRVPLEDDLLILPIELRSPEGVVRQSVRYRIDRDGDSPTLRRSIAVLGAAPDEFTEMGAAVAEGVLSMRVQVLEGGLWHGDFSDTIAPEAIRVSLVLQDSVRQHEQIARMAEFSLSTL